MIRVAGVIPAAGASRRMGEPKAMLELEGRTFLSHAVRALADGGCDPVVVVLPPHPGPVASEAVAAGATILANPEPGDGPITSLRLALRHFGDAADGLVLLPLDHPLVRSSLVSELLRAAEQSGAQLALPVVGGKRGHPTWFARALFAELADPELHGGARTVVHRHLRDALLLETHDAAAVTDVDTPADYAALLRQGAPDLQVAP